MKKNRATLKEYFKKGAIPTDSNFADLIDSMLNQEEDNIGKLPNDPLKIIATGTDEALLNFYRVEQNQEKLTWQLKQKTGGKAGLSIGDETGSRLFVENGSGKVGIGTTTPTQTLDVRGRMNVENGVIQRGGAAITNTSDLGLYSQVDRNWIRIVTTNAPIRFFTDGGIGTNSELSVEKDAVSVSGSLSVKNGPLTIGSIQISTFNDQEVDQWPNFVWYRDTSKNWDEGLIKHGTARGKFGRAGYGIHLHQSREFGFFSTNWTPLFAVEGGSGNAYFRGNLQLGNSDLYFTKTDHDHSGFGNAEGYAAIENAANYDALMILGRSKHENGRLSKRIVRLWDYLEVVGEFRVTGAQNIFKVATFTLAITNGGTNTAGKWSVDYSDNKFSEIYTVFVSLQGYSLWNNAGQVNFPHWGHVDSAGAIPQHTFVRVTSYNTQKASGTAYCSESNAAGEGDNTVLFTVVVMGRV